MTRALILAAGRGERLRPYTDTVPKPLLPVGAHRLWDWQIAALRRAGVTELVANTAHLPELFEDLPARYAGLGLSLRLSREGSVAAEALETLGGIVRARPLLSAGDEPFLVVAGDVTHGFPLRRLLAAAADLRAGLYDAHLLAVPNPPYHRRGDLTVAPDGSVRPGPGPHTYACVALLAPRLLDGLRPVRARLFPWLWTRARARATLWTGYWENIGTVAQYEALRANARAQRRVGFHAP